ncbi:MAG TPA: DHHA1 domain-containing protein, partial [Thermoguttaceae bacterium]|nr:DHHA1 domain-containing protein [Thermoguttaceae bacterium]
VGPSVESLLEEATKIGDVTIVAAEVPEAGPDDLRHLIDQLRRKAAPVAVILGSRQEDEGKVMLVTGLSRDLVEQGLDAVAWIRQVAKLVKGGGGGRPDMAQAGGKQPDKLPEALEAARGTIAKMLAG